MREIRKLLLVAVLLPFMIASVAYSQQGPNAVTPLAKCIIPFTINSTGTGVSGHFQPSTTGYDNRQSGCTNWAIYYSSTGYTVISLVLQSAPALSNTAPGTPDTYVTFAGTTVSGINPNTATTQASSTFSGYFPWIRINAATLTGTGTIVGVLLGTLPIDVSGGSAVTTNCPNPCPVDGPDAVAAASTTPPVQIGGNDGAVVRRIVVDTSGRQIEVGASASGAAKAGNPVQQGGVFNTTQPTVTTGQTVEAQYSARGSQLVTPGVEGFPVTNTDTATSTALADGLSNTEPLPTASAAAVNQRVFPMNFNGSTWDRELRCTNQALFNLSGSGNTQIVALSGSTTIYVCSISFSTTATEDVKLTTGTGSNCATGNADLTGLYKSVQSMALDFSSKSPLKGVASAALCLNQSAVQALGGIVIYAQF